MARRQDVTLVAEAGAQAAVRGLTAGARVISPVPASLEDGAAIEASAAGAGVTPAPASAESTGTAGADQP